MFVVNQRIKSGSTSLPVGLLALFLLGISGSLSLLYSSVSIPDLQALRHAIYERNALPEFVLQVTAARFAQLRFGLLACVVGASLIIAYLLWKRRLAPELRVCRQELHHALASVGEALARLSKAERWLGGLVLVGVLALRIYYFLVYPLGTDEVATYDYFVRGGPVAITSFYPIPNNHILFSLSCWVVSWFTHHDVLILRVPTLVVSLFGTLVTYALLLRLTNFRVATLAVGLFCFSPLSVYYAVVGRGYFLLITLAILQFLAALAILHSKHYQRLGWGVFVITGVLGMYTIPTYAYPLASLGFWLTVVFLRRRDYAALGHVLGAGGCIVLGTLVLYGPIICVSGLQALTGNEYVAPQPLSLFWPNYLSYLQQPAHELFGHERLSVAAFLGVMLLSFGVLPLLPAAHRRVAVPALVVVLLPFLFMPLQRVYASARVLMYATFFFFLAAALAADWLLGTKRLATRQVLPLLGFMLLGYGSYQTVLYRHYLRNARAQEQQLKQTYAWLEQRKPHKVLFEAPFHKLYFHHYATVSGYPLHLFEASASPPAHYDYLVVARGQRPLPSWIAAGAYRSAYSDGWVTIWEPTAAAAGLAPRTSAAAPNVRK
ncbi:hypothetical protein GCM10027346_04470 [Hymenobacter seoulensis]